MASKLLVVVERIIQDGLLFRDHVVHIDVASVRRKSASQMPEQRCAAYIRKLLIEAGYTDAYVHTPHPQFKMVSCSLPVNGWPVEPQTRHVRENIASEASVTWLRLQQFTNKQLAASQRLH